MSLWLPEVGLIEKEMCTMVRCALFDLSKIMWIPKHKGLTNSPSSLYGCLYGFSMSSPVVNFISTATWIQQDWYVFFLWVAHMLSRVDTSIACSQHQALAGVQKLTEQRPFLYFIIIYMPLTQGTHSNLELVPRRLLPTTTSGLVKCSVPVWLCCTLYDMCDLIKVLPSSIYSKSVVA